MKRFANCQRARDRFAFVPAELWSRFVSMCETERDQSTVETSILVTGANPIRMPAVALACKPVARTALPAGGAGRGVDVALPG